ncbi:MAG: polymer-forming cytoskeletal protein [Cyclobacteriaceae bacterium]
MFNNKQEQKENEELSNARNIIGKGTTLKGDLETFGNIRIEGKIIGNIKTKSKLIVGHSSNVEGNIIAQNADIEGHVIGNIDVSEILTLKSTAQINGDITTNKLIVESGATFNGGSKMGASIKEIRIGEDKNTTPNILTAQTS